MRELDPPLEDAIEAPVVNPFLGIFIDLPDPIYAWTGLGEITFPDSDEIPRTWIGAGGISAIDAIGEGTDGSAVGVKATLFGIPSSFRNDIADQAVRGVRMDFYVGALNETFQEVEGRKLLWRGKLDTYTIVDSGDTIMVEVTGESRMRDQGRPAIKRFTDEYQQRKHPGDKFFQFVPQMAEIPILWAKRTDAIGGGGGGSVGTGGSPQNYHVR
jgi:hypothetical protein